MAQNRWLKFASKGFYDFSFTRIVENLVQF